MVKQPQKNSSATADKLSVFDHFVRLTLKGLSRDPMKFFCPNLELDYFDVKIMGIN